MTADGKIKAFDDVIDAIQYLNQDCNKYDIRMMFTCARKLMELNGFKRNHRFLIKYICGGCHQNFGYLMTV